MSGVFSESRRRLITATRPSCSLVSERSLRVGDDDVDAVGETKLERGADLLHRRVVAAGRSTDAHMAAAGHLCVATAPETSRAARSERSTESSHATNVTRRAWQ